MYKDVLDIYRSLNCFSSMFFLSLLLLLKSAGTKLILPIFTYRSITCNRPSSTNASYRCQKYMMHAPKTPPSSTESTLPRIRYVCSSLSLCFSTCPFFFFDMPLMLNFACNLGECTFYFSNGSVMFTSRYGSLLLSKQYFCVVNQNYYTFIIGVSFIELKNAYRKAVWDDDLHFFC